jgi:hypothetical protein
MNHASTMHQPVPKPVINLYHKQVHQPCTNVTSRSGALTKLILWGHLLASDLDFYDDEPLNLDDDAS